MTGGKLPGDKTTEAEAGRRYAISKGVPEDAILVEDHGRTTLESLRTVSRILTERGLHSAVFVSDRTPHAASPPDRPRRRARGLRVADADEPDRRERERAAAGDDARGPGRWRCTSSPATSRSRRRVDGGPEGIREARADPNRDRKPPG
jgi:hypothetical protein